MTWFERFLAHANSLIETAAPVILAGDYNIVPTDADIYQTRSMDGNALIHPESRAGFARLVAQDWTDSLHERPPEGASWTFWSYMRDRSTSDKGMRLDHLLLSPSLSGRLVKTRIDRWVRGENEASDHAPAWIDLDLDGLNRQPN